MFSGLRAAKNLVLAVAAPRVFALESRLLYSVNKSHVFCYSYTECPTS
jgi:hypothetical protein